MDDHDNIALIREGVVKRLLQSTAAADDRTVLDDAARSLVGLWRRLQASEGIDAFMKKAAPPWRRG